MKRKVILASVVMLGMISSTYAADLGKIEVVNNGNLSISTTSDLVLPKWEVKWDLKVLKDYLVSFAYKDPQNSKKVSINLTYDLEKNKSYSLIWIDGAEANMNFDLKDEIKTEILNTEKTGDLYIEKINILDSKTVEVYYNKDLTAEDFTYKFLSEVWTKSQTSDGKTLNVELATPLEDLTPYIVLSKSLSNVDGKNVDLKDVYYEFETIDNLTNIFEDLPSDDLTVATEDTFEEVSTWNIEEIAQNAKKTPQTWPEAWFALTLALLVAWALYSRKKS